jgi:hypothetical protein
VTQEIGLREYERLSWRSLLNRQGQLDVNAARNIIGSVIGMLSIVSSQSIEGGLKQIESRVSYLAEIRAHNSRMQETVTLNVTTPSKAPATGVGLGDFDPRLPAK